MQKIVYKKLAIQSKSKSIVIRNIAQASVDLRLDCLRKKSQNRQLQNAQTGLSVHYRFQDNYPRYKFRGYAKSGTSSYLYKKESKGFNVQTQIMSSPSYTTANNVELDNREESKPTGNISA